MHALNLASPARPTLDGQSHVAEIAVSTRGTNITHRLILTLSM